MKTRSNLFLRASFLASVSIVISASSAQATSGTWLNTGATDGNWTTTSNWVGGTVPGSTVAITGTNANADIATFNTAPVTYGVFGSPILIDSTSENIKGITFNSGTGSYFIGTTGGNSLYLSSGGSIFMSNTGGAISQTINAPLVIEGASGTYTLQNDWNNTSALMAVNGQISGGNAGATTLTLTGTQSGGNFNAVNGNVIDGLATSLAINKSGGGTWILAGANTYTGGTTVSLGTLYAQDGASAAPGANNFIKGLGTGTVALSGGTLNLRANGSGSTQTIITGDGATGNNVTVSVNSTINVANLTTNTGSTIRFNNLSIGAQTLGVTGGNTYGLQFAGTTSITGAATFNPTSAPLSLSAMTIDNTVGTGTTTTVTLGGTSAHTGTGIISNNGTDATKVLALTKSNTSTWTLSGANTYTGATNVTGGTLTIGGAVGSSISNSSSVSVTGGTAVVLDYTTVGDAATNKINDTATVTISAVGSPNASGNSGLQLLGNATVNTNETIGTLAFGAGASIVGVTQATGGRVTSITATSGLTRASFGTALLRGSSLGGQATQVGQIILGSLTGLVQVGTSTSTTGAAGTTKDLTIVPYLIGDTSASGLGSAGSGSFVTYDTFGRGFRVLATGEQNALTLTTDTFTNTNVAYNASGTLTLDATNRTWNSLQIGHSGTFVSRTLTGGGGTLAITSGALQTGDQTAGDATIINGFSKITFGNNATVSNLANEAVIFVNGSSGGAAAPLTIGSPIDVTQGGGLTKAGTGTLILTAANAYSGATTINQGTLQIGNGTATGDLGISSGVALNGGTLTFNRSDAFSYTNTITGTSTGAITRRAGTGALTLGPIIGIGTLTDSSTTGSTEPTTITQTGTGLTIGTINGASGSVVNLGGTGITSITNVLNTAGQTVSFNAGTINLNGNGSYGSTLVVNGATVNTLNNGANTTNFRDVVNLQVLGGTFNVQSGSALRIGSNSGTSNATGAASATALQSGGTINFTNNATLQLGSNGLTAFTDTFALSGGVFSALNTASTGISIGAGTTGGGTSSFNFSGGTLRVGGTISGAQGAGAQQSFVWTGGTLAAGTYNATNLTSTQGTAVVLGSTNTLTNASAGILAPGDIGTAGKMAITGNYNVTSVNAALAIDLGGTTVANAFQNTAASASFDLLAVSGTVSLGGTLNVSLINGFTPTNANTFTIITGSSVSNTFTNLTGGKVTLAGGATFNVAVSGTTVVLSNYTVPVGNTYATWISGFSVGGQTAANDDFDKDGLSNVVENVLGSDPSVYSSGLTQISSTANSVTFRHNQSNTIATDVTKTYQWSTDLVEWKSTGQTNSGGTTATIVANTITDVAAPANDVIEVTVTVTAGPATKVFGRLVATKAP